jgi:hypothetical protein
MFFRQGQPHEFDIERLSHRALTTLPKLPQLLNRPQLRHRPCQLRLRFGNLHRPDAIA